MVRKKTRIEHMADALTSLETARLSLDEVDLRKIPDKGHREALKWSRDSVNAAIFNLGVVITEDAP